MEYNHRINSIRERAARIGAPMRDIAAKGGVSASTLYRWQQDDANPRMRSMLSALDAMEADLAAREAKLVAALTGDAA